MSTTRQTPRQKLRNRPKFPAGMFSALMTATLVTLVGVAMRHPASEILYRAAISSLVVGCLMSLGVAIIRIADSEQVKK